MTQRLPLSVQLDIDDKLQAIARHFVRPRITLVVRPDIGPDKDGHVILTDDDLSEVIRLLAARAGESA